MTFDPLEIANHQLGELSSWHPELLELLTPTTPAIQYRATRGGTGRHATSVPERYAHHRERLDKDWATIETYAAELAWRAGMDGDPALFMRGRLTWAANHYPHLDDMLATISNIHLRWKNMLRLVPQPTSIPCPLCGKTVLRVDDAGRLHCDVCQTIRSKDEIDALVHYRITNSDAWITRAQARAVFGLTRDQLKWHIRTGHLNLQDGLVSTVELRALPRRETR